MIKFSIINRLRSLAVENIMNRELIKIAEMQPMVDVAKEFRAQQISSAPVINERNICVGILSAVDFFDRAKTFSATSENDFAGSFMTRSPLTVTPQTTLLCAAEIMTTNHIHRLPVVDGHNHVVGIVSTMDVVAALLNAIEEWESRL